MRERGAVRLPCRPPGSNNVNVGSGSKGRAKKTAGGLNLRLSVGNRQFREATAFSEAARSSPSAYLTGAFTGGGKGSA